MKRRIVLYQMVYLCLGLILALAAGMYWADRQFQQQTQQELSASVNTVVHLCANPGSDPDRFVKELALQQVRGVRVTLIDRDGRVLGDSQASFRTMENHSERPEIRQALAEGTGQYSRSSLTTGIDTLYIAQLWGEQYILRFALASTARYSFFQRTLLSSLLVLLLLTIAALATARRLSERILQPIRVFAGEAEAVLEPQHSFRSVASEYEELQPMAQTLNELGRRQNAYIEALREQNSKIEQIVSAMQEGLLLLDSEKNILLSNPQALKLLDLTQNQGNLLRLLREEKLRRAFEAVQVKGPSEIVELQKRGRDLRLHLSAVPAGGYVLFVSDVSQIMHLENLRSEFAANVSHELKTPLTSISGFCELIAAGMVEDSQQVRSFAQRSYDEAQRLMQLISDILLLSELEGGGEHDLQQVNLRSSFREALAALQSQCEEMDLQVEIEGEAMVQAHPVHIMELVHNLTENAVKYNRQGGSLRVSIYTEGSRSCFTVQDSGIGIAPEHQQRIFERFYRVDKARSRKTGGTGLGLSIAKHIVERYSGSISVRSDERGSAFVVCLPSA